MNNAPEKQEVLALLRGYAPQLKAAGILHLSVFGSVARDEATAASDVDLLAEFDASLRLTLPTLGGLESDLTELLGRQVDLSSAKWLKDAVRDRALSEALLVF